MVWYAVACTGSLQQALACFFLPPEMYHGTYTERAATDTSEYIIAGTELITSTKLSKLTTSSTLLPLVATICMSSYLCAHLGDGKSKIHNVYSVGLRHAL